MFSLILGQDLISRTRSTGDYRPMKMNTKRGTSYMEMRALANTWTLAGGRTWWCLTPGKYTFIVIFCFGDAVSLKVHVQIGDRIQHIIYFVYIMKEHL